MLIPFSALFSPDSSRASAPLLAARVTQSKRPQQFARIVWSLNMSCLGSGTAKLVCFAALTLLHMRADHTVVPTLLRGWRTWQPGSHLVLVWLFSSIGIRKVLGGNVRASHVLTSGNSSRSHECAAPHDYG